MKENLNILPVSLLGGSGVAAAKIYVKQELVKIGGPQNCMKNFILPQKCAWNPRFLVNK